MVERLQGERSERPGGRALELYYTGEVRGEGRTENEGKKLHEEVHETAYKCRCSVTAPTAAVPPPFTAAGAAAAASSNHQPQSSD
nr:hypothetical transcript [Hymenolepis microstoma]